MLTAPEIVITYTRNRCNARVAAQAGDDRLAAAYFAEATAATRRTAGTEWQLIDRVATVFDRNPFLSDLTEALRLAGLQAVASA